MLQLVRNLWPSPVLDIRECQGARQEVRCVIPYTTSEACSVVDVTQVVRDAAEVLIQIAAAIPGFPSVQPPSRMISFSSQVCAMTERGCRGAGSQRCTRERELMPLVSTRQKMSRETRYERPGAGRPAHGAAFSLKRPSPASNTLGGRKSGFGPRRTTQCRTFVVSRALASQVRRSRA